MLFSSSQLVNAWFDQLSSSSDKALVAVYVWSAIVHIFSLRRLVKRWRYADGGFAFLDVTHFALFFLGLCFTSQFSSMRTWGHSIVLECTGGVSAWPATSRLSCASGASQATSKRRFDGRNCYDHMYLRHCAAVSSQHCRRDRSVLRDRILRYYSVLRTFLVIILLIALINEGHFETVGVFGFSARLSARARIYDHGHRLFRDSRTVRRGGSLCVHQYSTFTCVALLLLKLFMFPVFRASVAQFYMQSIFKMRHKGNEIIQSTEYCSTQALVDMFPKNPRIGLRRAATRKLREALGSNEGKRTAQSDASSRGPVEREVNIYQTYPWGVSLPEKLSCCRNRGLWSPLGSRVAISVASSLDFGIDSPAVCRTLSHLCMLRMVLNCFRRKLMSFTAIPFLRYRSSFVAEFCLSLP